jgi:hypothetical protein
MFLNDIKKFAFSIFVYLIHSLHPLRSFPVIIYGLIHTDDFSSLREFVY